MQETESPNLVKISAATECDHFALIPWECLETCKLVFLFHSRISEISHQESQDGWRKGVCYSERMVKAPIQPISHYHQWIAGVWNNPKDDVRHRVNFDRVLSIYIYIPMHFMTPVFLVFFFTYSFRNFRAGFMWFIFSLYVSLTLLSNIWFFNKRKPWCGVERICTFSDWFIREVRLIIRHWILLRLLVTHRLRGRADFPE